MWKYLISAFTQVLPISLGMDTTGTMHTWALSKGGRILALFLFSQKGGWDYVKQLNMLILSRCQFLISKWNVSKKSLFWEDGILFCGPGTPLSRWNHNRNKITIEFKRQACGSVVHNLSRFHGCMRWAELSLRTLHPTEAVSSPPQRKTEQHHWRGAGEGTLYLPQTCRHGSGQSAVQPQAWLSEHWLFSSPGALQCSCQMALPDFNPIACQSNTAPRFWGSKEACI